MARDIDSEFTEYVASRSTVLFGTAIRLCAGDRHTAEDLVQATLARAYVSWKQVRDPQARDAYVRRIMVRQAYRLAKAREFVVHDPAALLRSAFGGHIPGPEVELVQQLLLWSLLKQLPVKQRTVVVLRYFEDLSEAEIAAAMGCSRGTVKTHASRAIRQLRQQLEGQHLLSETKGADDVRH